MAVSKCCGFYILPLLAFIIYIVCLPTMFIWAIIINHHNLFREFPYISDVAARGPENTLFIISSTFIALILSACMYIRYMHIREVDASQQTLNTAALVVGLGSSICLFFTSSISEYYPDLVVLHFIFAISAGILGCVYYWSQTYLSFAVRPHIVSECISFTQLILAFLITLLSITIVTCSIVAKAMFDGKDFTRWKDTDKGYLAHKVGGITEWISVTLNICFYLTYSKEFYHLTLVEPRVIIDSTPMHEKSKLINNNSSKNKDITHSEKNQDQTELK